MNYEESVAYMSGLLAFGLKLGRERFAALLERLGNPHQRLRCVHVAGTNGKGSTTTFVAAALRAAGYSVGAYFSPYVFDLRERVQVDGQMISRDDFARWVTVIRPHIEAVAADPELGQTTEFELKTAVAFCHFAERGVDFAVIEVGIGGRLDATNVIPPPLAAVITQIGLDHTGILGDTVAEIAAEKAGILKSGTVGVTAVPPGPALDVIAATAEARGCPLYRVQPASEVSCQREKVGDTPFVTYETDAEGRVTIVTPGGTLAGLTLSLSGPFQAANAAAAAAAVEVLRRRGVAVPQDALRRGLQEAQLPGRFQVVAGGEDGGPALVLDGAHNEDGAAVLAEALRTHFPGRRPVLVVGTKKSHEPAPFLRVLAPLAPRVVATAPPFRPTPASEIAAAAARLGLAVETVEPASEAIAATYRTAGADEVVVVTGSFYTVGETPPELRGHWAGSALPYQKVAQGDATP